jgi:hypothetical protein
VTALQVGGTVLQLHVLECELVQVGEVGGGGHTGKSSARVARRISDFAQ